MALRGDNGHTTNYLLGMTKAKKPKPRVDKRLRPESTTERLAIIERVIEDIAASGTVYPAIRACGIPVATFYRWIAVGPADLRARYVATTNAAARHAVDVMADLAARAGARALAAAGDNEELQEVHYSRYIAPLVRWRAERTLPEFAPRSETVSVRIDIRSTLAQMIDSVDTADVIDADDLPAIPAPGDYAGD